MSRNGRDQMSSSAAFRMAARVRSALPILSTGCGLTRSRDDDCFKTDTMSCYHYPMSDCKVLGIGTQARTPPLKNCFRRHLNSAITRRSLIWQQTRVQKEGGTHMTSYRIEMRAVKTRLELFKSRMIKQTEEDCRR